MTSIFLKESKMQRRDIIRGYKYRSLSLNVDFFPLSELRRVFRRTSKVATKVKMCTEKEPQGCSRIVQLFRNFAQFIGKLVASCPIVSLLKNNSHLTSSFKSLRSLFACSPEKDGSLRLFVPEFVWKWRSLNKLSHILLVPVNNTYRLVRYFRHVEKLTLHCDGNKCRGAFLIAETRQLFESLMDKHSLTEVFVTKLYGEENRIIFFDHLFDWVGKLSLKRLSVRDLRDNTKEIAAAVLRHHQPLQCLEVLTLLDMEYGQKRDWVLLRKALHELNLRELFITVFGRVMIPIDHFAANFWDLPGLQVLLISGLFLGYFRVVPHSKPSVKFLRLKNLSLLSEEFVAGIAESIAGQSHCHLELAISCNSSGPGFEKTISLATQIPSLTKLSIDFSYLNFATNRETQVFPRKCLSLLTENRAVHVELNINFPLGKSITMGDLCWAAFNDLVTKLSLRQSFHVKVRVYEEDEVAFDPLIWDGLELQAQKWRDQFRNRNCWFDIDVAFDVQDRLYWLICFGVLS